MLPKDKHKFGAELAKDVQERWRICTKGRNITGRIKAEGHGGGSCGRGENWGSPSVRSIY